MGTSLQSSAVNIYNMDIPLFGWLRKFKSYFISLFNFGNLGSGVIILYALRSDDKALYSVTLRGKFWI